MEQTVIMEKKIGIRKEFDVEKIRKDFPILKLLVHDKPLCYFDNAATTQKPLVVINAIGNYYKYQNTNIHRGVHYLSESATKAYDNARIIVQKFINAASEKEIIFTRGTTESINLAAQTFGRQILNEGDEIILSHMEHHSNIVPWQLIAGEKRAILKVIPITDEGELDLEEFEKLITSRTKIVSVVYVSNSLGTTNPVDKIIEIAHTKMPYRIPVLIDAAQAANHLPIDVQKLDCDFLTFSGHKMYGPTGIGVLYCKKEILESLPPYQGGGDMISKVTFEETTYNELPYKYEAGTPNIEGAIGLGVAIDYISKIGMENIAAYEKELLEYASSAVTEIDEVKIIGTAKNKCSVISFVIDNIHPHDVGTLLDLEGIAIRTGHHCTQPVMARYNVPATSRISLSFYNTKQEIDTLVNAIKKVLLLDEQSQELYQQVILDHNRNPRNFKKLDNANHHAEGYNPLCGDLINIYIVLCDDIIRDISFHGQCCAISKASASMMIAMLKGKSKKEAEEIYDKFNDLISGRLVQRTTNGNDNVVKKLGNLAVFEGVKEFPARIKCASLAWQTMKLAFDSKG